MYAISGPVKDLPVNQRQKSLEVMDPGARDSAARLVRPPGGRDSSGGSLKLKEKMERSNSMPTPPHSQAGARSEAESSDSAFSSAESPASSSADPGHLPHSAAPAAGHPPERASVSNDNNILLDPDVLTDHVTQVIINNQIN